MPIPKIKTIIASLFIGAAILPNLTLAQTDASKIQTAEKQLTVAGPIGPLAGSYIDAGKQSPVMLIIPGSGPTDRDGNNPLGINGSSYKLLAQALAAKGVSTLRIDKRGMFGSDKAVADANAVTIADYAADTAEWSKAALKESGGKCVWIAGHSEGGLVALAAAQKQDGICGVILLTAPGRNLADVLYEQIHANPINTVLFADADRALSALRSGQKIDVAAMHPALQQMFAPDVQGFLIDLFSYDPAALAKAVKQPMLIIAGGRDIQVKAADADTFAAAQPAAKRITIDAMTHTLKRVDSDDTAANMATYTNPSLPVMPELVDAIAAFVGK